MRFRRAGIWSFDVIGALKLPLSSALLIFSFVIAGFAFDDTNQKDIEDPRDLLKKAEKLKRQGQMAEAEKILRRLIKIEPDKSKSKLLLAYVLLQQRKINEAYKISLNIAQIEPKNSYAFAVLGGTLLSAGEFESARLSFTNAIFLDRGEALAWAGLGMIDFYENKIKESLEKLREAVYLESNEPDFYFALGQVSARAEKYKEAAQAYERFLSVAMQNDDDRRERIKGLIRFLRYLDIKESLYKMGGAESTTVPFSLVGNRPVVEVKVNGGDETLRFVLDTGSSISVISNETAERLKIKAVTRGGQARALGGDGKFDIVYGFLKKVDIGDVRVRNVPVYIREFHHGSQTVDGYIGISLISKFLTTVDYGNLTFSLERRNQKKEKSSETEELSLPLRLTSSGFLSGQVQLEGVENSLNFIVDTGASISVISDDLASTKEVAGFTLDETMRVIGAAGITENVPSYMLPRLTVGPHTRQSIRAVALDLDMINEASGFEQAGILGGNFLKDYRLTFDFENSRVIFVPNDK
ncbi:MAG: aspartyl protease family protein [Pyrinomonadaceae bacterium]|nr:aspartyl protease family protein [Pyrinomonadaceae bacterium]